MILAWLLLAGMCLAAGVALARWSLVAAVALSGLSALWLPYNNGRLEGATIYAVEPGHGLTVMDLLAYAGLAVALGVSLTSRHRRLRLPVAAVCCLTVGAGLAAAYFLWSGPPAPGGTPVTHPAGDHSQPPAHRTPSALVGRL